MNIMGLLNTCSLMVKTLCFQCRGYRFDPCSGKFCVLREEAKNKQKPKWILADFIFGGSKITADGDCSHEIKRRLLIARKVMTNLDSILKSRDITLSTKIHLVKAMVFCFFFF